MNLVFLYPFRLRMMRFRLGSCLRVCGWEPVWLPRSAHDADLIQDAAPDSNNLTPIGIPESSAPVAIRRRPVRVQG